MSTQPGVTSRPAASISSSPAGRSRPTSVMRPPSTAMSATYAGAPVPSTTVPLRITSSAMADPLVRPVPRACCAWALDAKAVHLAQRASCPAPVRSAADALVQAASGGESAADPAGGGAQGVPDGGDAEIGELGARPGD